MAIVVSDDLCREQRLVVTGIAQRTSSPAALTGLSEKSKSPGCEVAEELDSHLVSSGASCPRCATSAARHAHRNA